MMGLVGVFGVGERVVGDVLERLGRGGCCLRGVGEGEGEGEVACWRSL